jgi:transglutaminase-like putative cysteine protease
MHYTVRHVTKFTYEEPISESVMEARVQPRTDGTQRCLQFRLTTVPRSNVMVFHDHEHNLVHHFDIPARHSQLVLTTDASVECTPPPDVPETLGAGAWHRLEEATASGEFWELQNPSPFIQWTERLDSFAREVGAARLDDPLETVRTLSARLYDAFDYCPQSTRVDSPIDEALSSRQGVCQDFTHILIALVRRLAIPCRYVSGYLFHHTNTTDRSSDDATHAWAEAWFPELGWIGFDPTNNLMTGERHIRVAIGRDYADVPPTRGVYKGNSAARSELAVAVNVGAAAGVAVADVRPFVSWPSRDTSNAPTALDHLQEQQQQQQ